MDEKLYVQLSTHFKEWHDLDYQRRYSERIALSKQIAKIMDNIDHNSLNKRIKSELEKGYHCFIHPVFGVIDNKKEPLKEIRQNLLKKTKDDIEKLEDQKPFMDKINNANYVDIYTYDDKLVRNKVADMPEIKFRNITKSFNPATLQAYISLDTETTGLKGGVDRIVQISAAKVEEGDITEIFAVYINPLRPIPAEATAVNGITDQDVANAPTLDMISRSLIEFVGDLPIIGYNTAFDLKFLYCSGIDFITKRKLFDVSELARKLLKDSYIESYTLSNVAEELNIHFPPHNAVADCIATHEVFQKLLSYYWD